MRFAPSSALVRNSLSAHSWIGLVVGALMYLVCLSGTLAVFFEEFERWEQPYAQEFLDFDPRALEQTFNHVLASGAEITPHMYLVLPTEAVPRARIATEEMSWFLNADGSIGREERNDWTEMLLDLHLYLHLPESWGMILVSALGGMLCGLIVSGLAAHPRIFKDAFNLRLNGSRRLEQADIHNRLSVWGVPFHLMIAITGAYFGLALPLLAVFAGAFNDGNSEAVVEAVFGKEPELQQEAGPLAIAGALDRLETLAPEATPFLITAHDVGTPGQFFAISATLPGRMIWSENYLFDADGNFLRTDGFSDGAAGKQIIYSIYRLHFGHFGGLPVKIVYGMLGLALTIVSVTGINVWLARRRTRDWLNDVWTGIVWGAPVALVVSAFAQLVHGISSGGIFWFAMFGSGAFCLRLQDDRCSRRALQGAFAGATAVLLCGYGLRFGADALSPAAVGVNAVLLGAAALFGSLALRNDADDGLPLVKRNENHYHRTPDRVQGR